MTVLDGRDLAEQGDIDAEVVGAAVASGGRSWKGMLERSLGWLVVAALVLLWEVAARLEWMDPRILNPPSEVATTIWDLLREGTGWRDIRATTVRFVTGMLVGTLAGVILGLVMGLFVWPRLAMRRVIQVLYPLPRIALFPIMLILLGANERTYMYAIALGPFFTMVLTTEAAVLEIPPIYRDVAKSFEANVPTLYRRVIVPAALPMIMSGVRISLGVALLGTTAVEFLQTQDGLGHLIWRSWQLLSFSDSIAGLVLTAIIGVIAFVLVDVLERFLIPWKVR